MNQTLPNPLVVMALEEESGDAFRRAGIAVLYTGVGKVNAAYSLTRKLSEYLLSGYPLPLVVNFGTAGSRSFPSGSLVACSAFTQRDMNATALNFSIGTTPFDSTPPLLKFPTVLTGLPQGICGTGDSFATTDMDAQYDVIDMEAFSLAKVCWFYGSTFVSVKYITDGCNSESANDWAANLRQAGKRFMEVFDQLPTTLSRRDELIRTSMQYIREVPDFPVAGIVFKDISPLLRDRFGETIETLDGLLDPNEWNEIDVVVGVESRGFVLAAALAQRRSKGFVPVRKAGKLPPPVVSCGYKLEYGEGILEMHVGSGRVLVVDDVLATGGTLSAAADLSTLAGYRVAHLLVLIDLGIAPSFRWRGMAARSALG